MVLYIQISVIFTPHPGNLFLQHIKTICCKPQAIKYRIVEPRSNRYIYKILPHLRPRGHCRREGRKIVRASRSGSFLWYCVSNNIRNYTHKVPTAWLPIYEVNKEDTNEHTELGRGKPMRPQPYTKNDGHLRMHEWLSHAK